MLMSYDTYMAILFLPLPLYPDEFGRSQQLPLPVGDVVGQVHVGGAVCHVHLENGKRREKIHFFKNNKSQFF